MKQEELLSMKRELFALIASLDNEEQVRALFEDLCTVKEIEQMAQRVRAARLLLGGMTYNQVIELTDISSATLSRVSKSVKYGSGYAVFCRDAQNGKK